MLVLALLVVPDHCFLLLLRTWHCCAMLERSWLKRHSSPLWHWLRR
jgi:hypothetical protein